MPEKTNGSTSAAGSCGECSKQKPRKSRRSETSPRLRRTARTDTPGRGRSLPDCPHERDGGGRSSDSGSRRRCRPGGSRRSRCMAPFGAGAARAHHKSVNTRVRPFLHDPRPEKPAPQAAALTFSEEREQPPLRRSWPSFPGEMSLYSCLLCRPAFSSSLLPLLPGRR